MIVAAPQGFFSNRIRLSRNDVFLTEMKISLWTEQSGFEWEGIRYRLRRERRRSGAYVLESPDGVVARIIRKGVFRPTFELTSAERACTIRRTGFWRSDFTVFEGDRLVGRIAASGWFNRTNLADLPDSWPVPLQALLIWLAFVVRNQEAATATVTAG